ncbi:MAG: hypothetical protein ACLQBJ_10905 [Bryobacteraceae bacterium]
MAGSAAAPEPQPAPAPKAKIDVYKWAAGIALPILLALIPVLWPKSGEIKLPNNTTVVTNISVIENQFQTVTGKRLEDSGLKTQLQAAVNLAKAGQYEASRQMFLQLAGSVPVPAVYNNLGALASLAGDAPAAREAYQRALAKDPGFKPALSNMSNLTAAAAPANRAVRDRELEPNNDPAHANILPLSTPVAAEITPNDTDYFQITAPRPPRDHLKVSVRNTSTTLTPVIDLYDARKNRLGEDGAWTAGADFETTLNPSPGDVYYVQVSGRNGSTGTYELTVTPLHAYDRYEPNDTILQATPIGLNQSIEANIMDNQDADYYQVQASGNKLTAHVANKSTTLKPCIAVFDGQKNKITEDGSYTAGGDWEMSSAATPGQTYYIDIWGRDGSAGSYVLTVK